MGGADLERCFAHTHTHTNDKNINEKVHTLQPAKCPGCYRLVPGRSVGSVCVCEPRRNVLRYKNNFITCGGKTYSYGARAHATASTLLAKGKLRERARERKTAGGEPFQWRAPRAVHFATVSERWGLHFFVCLSQAAAAHSQSQPGGLLGKAVCG